MDSSLAPRACFGRDGLIEQIVDLAEKLTPIALIGPGGIGKTSIALTVLHHDHIKKRFGDNRRFIRCDQFTASCPNFLRRLSKVVGAGVENPEDLTPLRPSLTSKEMLIVLDNAESILDLQGASAVEISAMVDELSQFSNVWLLITSRITNVPPYCEALEIPMLPMEAACDAFYRIYRYGGQSDSVNSILKQLDFHPLSITLLATVAHQNKWDNTRFVEEWKQRQTGVFQAGRNKSLAHTIELSLASPMFGELGTNARGLLEVVAFFPQGIAENNLDWLFPTIPSRTTIFDTFCVLSLTYRNDGFITMLAPLRDYLCPQDPMSSSLLYTTKDRYFTRMSILFDRNTPAFRESRWIMLEDLNVEHLLNVLTSVDANTNRIWEACAHFIQHLCWHKPRRTILGQKIEGLPDDHPYKTKCSFELARLFHSVGNQMERKRLLSRALKLAREQVDDGWVAQILAQLSDANRMLRLRGEGIQQAREAFEINQRLGLMAEQARCLTYLAWLLFADGQLDAGKQAASRVIDLLPEKGQEYIVCQSHRLLGETYRFKGKKEKAISHFDAALSIASPFDWHDLPFCIHHSLAELFLDGRDFGNAQTHVGQARLHAANDAFSLGRTMHLQAQIWYRQRRLKGAKYEASRAFETFERLGAAKDIESCRTFLQKVERAMENQSISNTGEFLEYLFLHTPVNPS